MHTTSVEVVTRIVVSHRYKVGDVLASGLLGQVHLGTISKIDVDGGCPVYVYGSGHTMSLISDIDDDPTVRKIGFQDKLWEQTVFDDTIGRTHRDDPHTSQAAAQTQAVKSGTNRHRVLTTLAGETFSPDIGYTIGGQLGATDYELGVALNMLRTAAGTRRKELQEWGLVEPIPNLLRPTDTGHQAQVWRITPTGIERLDRVKMT